MLFRSASRPFFRYKLSHLTPTRNYGEAEFKDDLRELIKGAVKSPHSFLFSDSDVIEESFLESINNLLTIGTVPALFAEDQKEAVVGQIRAQAQAHGVLEDALWSYALSRARANLHIILAMSPAGDTLRARCRSFPGLVSCTSIDWFYPWPRDALREVAKSFLKEQDLPEDLREDIEMYVVDVHVSITKTYSPEFERKLNRKNFATPKNYIDFLQSYAHTLEAKRSDMDALSDRLEGGLQKMQSVRIRRT